MLKEGGGWGVIRGVGLVLGRLWLDLQTGQCRYEGRDLV